MWEGGGCDGCVKFVHLGHFMFCLSCVTDYVSIMWNIPDESIFVLREDDEINLLTTSHNNRCTDCINCFKSITTKGSTLRVSHELM